MNASTASPQTDPEEIANTLTHGLGIALAVLGAGILLPAASASSAPHALAACTVYGATMIVLYLASTLYHAAAIRHAGAAPARPHLRAFDHIAIFLLIAGTYTPYVLIALRGVWGWSLFALVWSLAAIGAAFELTALRRHRAMMVALYIGMGWVGIAAIRPLVHALAPAGLWLLFGGGAVYTLGVIFYKMHGLRYHHAIWHLFVLAGSVLQYFSILCYVIPSRP